MKNREIAGADDDAINDSSMQEIENSISSGSSAFDTPKPAKKGGKFLGVFLIILAAGIAAAGQFLLSSVDIQNISADAPIPANEGKLVSVSGNLAEGEFTDPMFKIAAKGILLERVVEMYQWFEEDGMYSKKWDTKVIGIAAEEAKAKGISNPAEMPLTSEKFQPDGGIKLGAFTLSPNLARQIGEPQDIAITQEDFNKLDAEGQQAFKLDNGAYFFGLDVTKPRVGDLKIYFRKIEATPVSVLAQQSGNNLTAFRTDNGVVEKLLPGNQSLETMLLGVNIGDNKYLQWGAFGGAGILAFFGLIKILTSPRAPKKPKEPKIKKVAPEKKAAAAEEMVAAPTIAAAAAALQDEQAFAEEDFAPAPAAEHHFEEHPHITEAAPEIHTPHATEPPEPPTSLDYNEPELTHAAPTLPPPPPLEFEAIQDEMPAGIEMIGPGSLPEPSYQAPEPAPQMAFAPEQTAPEASPEYHESGEMPAGIEMVGPDSTTNIYAPEPFSSPPSPEQDDAEIAEQHNTTPGLDYIPTYTPPPEEDEEQNEFAVPEYSAFELAELPPQFTVNNQSDETPEIVDEDLESELTTQYIPPPPLDFDDESETENTPSYENFNSEFMQSEGSTEYPEHEDEDYDLPEEDDTEAYLEDEFPPVPPLPFPDILKGRKMAFDDANEVRAEMEITEPPHQNFAADDSEEPHDAFSDLLKNIPDDFDPNAEMIAPENPEQPENNEEYFDPFAEPEDDNFSPFADAERK